MAKLGIDFGTTNTVAVVHDRGVFSPVLHRAETGAGTVVQDTWPSSILLDTVGGRRWFGLEADRRFGGLSGKQGVIFLPSLKRQLRDYSEGRLVDGGGASGLQVADLLTDFLKSLADSIRQSLGLPAEEPLEAVVTWPANANGAQRHITRRCFREAGFQVVGTLNEPTASAIELAECLTAGQGARAGEGSSRGVAVFDLGGGTFDASVVWIEGNDFEVLASTGIEDLGGDDFDRALLEMFLEKLKVPADSLSALTRHALLRHARVQKETIAGGAVRSLFLNPVDYGLRGAPVSLPVKAYTERLRPLLGPAMVSLRGVIEQAAERHAELRKSPLMVYLVGGSSRLPLVAEMVSTAFPDARVILTDKPFTSVAMGAAVSATDQVRYRDVFARHFGVIRLRDHGRSEIFDTLFPAGTPIPRRGEPPLERATIYHPRHNIGHLRYLECTAVDPDGLPAGNIRRWSDLLFPYDPQIPLAGRVREEQIEETDRYCDEEVCEIYRCDSDGVISVELRRPRHGEMRTHEIYKS